MFGGLLALGEGREGGRERGRKGRGIKAAGVWGSGRGRKIGEARPARQ